MRTEHLGPDEILLATKVEYDSKLTFDEVADAINATEANIRAAVPADTPDLHRARLQATDSRRLTEPRAIR